MDFTGRLRAHSSGEFCQWRCGSRAGRGRCCPPLSWGCPPPPSALCSGQQPAEIAHQPDSSGSVSMADTTELSSSSHPQLRGPACFSVLPHSLRQKALLLAWSVVVIGHQREAQICPSPLPPILLPPWVSYQLSLPLLQLQRALSKTLRIDLAPVHCPKTSKFIFLNRLAEGQGH